MKTSPHRRLASWGRSSGATTGRTTALAWRSPRCRPTGGTCGPKQQGNGCRVASSPGTKPKTHPGKRERAVCPRAAGEFEGRRSIPRQAPCVIHGVGWLDHLTVVQASPDSPAQAPQELPQLVPVSPFFEKLRLQLHPHRHLAQLRPGPHQLASRSVLRLQPLLATLQELPPPPLQALAAQPEAPGSPRRCPRREAAATPTSAFRCALHRFGRPSGLPRLFVESCSPVLRDIQCLLSAGPRNDG